VAVIFDHFSVFGNSGENRPKLKIDFHGGYPYSFAHPFFSLLDGLKLFVALVRMFFGVFCRFLQKTRFFDASFFGRERVFEKPFFSFCFF